MAPVSDHLGEEFSVNIDRVEKLDAGALPLMLLDCGNGAYEISCVRKVHLTANIIERLLRIRQQFCLKFQYILPDIRFRFLQ